MLTCTVGFECVQHGREDPNDAPHALHAQPRGREPQWALPLQPAVAFGEAHAHEHRVEGGE